MKSLTPIFLLIVTFFSLTSSCSPSGGSGGNSNSIRPIILEKGEQKFDQDGNPVEADLIYNIIDEKVNDVPVKTSITRHIEVNGKVTKASIEMLLQAQLNDARNRVGFEYHNPATHYQIIIYPENDSRWYGLLNSLPAKEVEVLINDLLITEKRKITTNKIAQFEIGQLDGLVGTYGFEKLKVLSTDPPHIQVSKEIFVHDYEEVKQVYAKQNFVEALIAILIHSNLDKFRLTAIPILYDFNKDSNGNIKSGLKSLGSYKNGRTTAIVERSAIETILKQELGIESIYDLAVDGYFYNHRAYNQMLYNDQGGITINKSYLLLSK